MTSIHIYNQSELIPAIQKQLGNQIGCAVVTCHPNGSNDMNCDVKHFQSFLQKYYKTPKNTRTSVHIELEHSQRGDYYPDVIITKLCHIPKK